MKNFLNADYGFEDLKKAVSDLQKKEDKKSFYIFLGIVIALFVAAVAGIIWFVKTKTDEDWDCCDWDDDFDDEEFDDETESGDSEECTCSDSDVDKSVNVEKLQ